MMAFGQAHSSRCSSADATTDGQLGVAYGSGTGKAACKRADLDGTHVKQAAMSGGMPLIGD
jgi:hypothetical protein